MSTSEAKSEVGGGGGVSQGADSSKLSPNWRERGQCLQSDSYKVRQLAGVGEEKQGGIMGNVPTASLPPLPKTKKKRKITAYVA